ncbi:hypothetical protein EJ04DRAFT_234040 [Polyplosphaeria fusca]|uniref:Uncharacterized protein n=1 Tax=Polyplosphaeria fusca TaxID=682080 RepID=A0A9P4V6T8_9PLEO|nr:hypothetical protein EJ04DRAFT_234040 [Polyplosphaeria fusca]
MIWLWLPGLLALKSRFVPTFKILSSLVGMRHWQRVWLEYHLYVFLFTPGGSLKVWNSAGTCNYESLFDCSAYSSCCLRFPNSFRSKRISSTWRSLSRGIPLSSEVSYAVDDLIRVVMNSSEVDVCCTLVAHSVPALGGWMGNFGPHILGCWWGEVFVLVAS